MSPDKTQFGDRFDGHMLPPRISKTDDDFAAENLEFVYGQEGLSISELNEVFEKVPAVQTTHTTLHPKPAQHHSAPAAGRPHSQGPNLALFCASCPAGWVPKA